MEIRLAPPAGGKTKFVLESIGKITTNGGLKKVWVLVPDQRQSGFLRNQLLEQGGMLGVHVGRFDALCKEILFAVKRYLPLLAPALRHRILGETLREMEQRGELVEFLPIAHFAGFQGLLHRVFDEFCQAGLTGQENALEALCCQISALEELVKIYCCYLEIVEKIQWLDPQGLMAYTAKVLQEEQPLHWQVPDLILLDGFDRFTNPQLALLKILDDLNIPVIITQTAFLEEQRFINRRFLRALTQLKETFPNASVSWISQESFLPQDLSRILRDLLKDDPEPLDDAPSLTMLAVQSPLEEVREGLRWIKQKIVLEQRSPSSLAVIIPDETTYIPLLKSISREYSIPLVFSTPEFLNQHAAIQGMLGLLTIRGQDFSRRLLLDLIRSPYLNLTQTFGLSSQDAAALELVSRSGPVVSGLLNWLTVLGKLAGEKTDVEAGEDLSGEQETNYTLPHGEEAARLQQGLKSLDESLTPLNNEQAVSDWIVWLAGVLEKVAWQDCLEGFGEPEIVEAVHNLFSGLRLGELKLGHWLVDYDQFLAILEGALGVVAYAQPKPENAVQVLRMIEARGIRFSNIVVMGLREGGFPKVTRPDPFLPDDFRTMFGLETRQEQDQASVFALAFSRADQSILVTRPYLAPNGEAIDPSPYWEGLVEIAGKTVVKTFRPGERRKRSEAASLQELLFWHWQFYQDLTHQTELVSAHLGLLVQRQVLADRKSKDKNSLYEGKFPDLPQRLKSMVDGNGVWSPSRLETYRSCGLRFLVQSALNLEEQNIPEPGLQANQVGSILHKILEEVYAAVEDPADLQAVLEALPGVAETVFAQAPQEYGFIPTPLWAVQQKEWLRHLETALVKLSEDGWSPLAQEQKFGLGGFPSLEIALEEGRKIRVRGIIDRLDRHADGSIRVVDYKTGGSHLTPEELINGTRLQLPLYALAVSAALGLDAPAEGFYWALLAEKAGSLKLSKFEFNELSGPSGANQVLMEHLNRILLGMEAADFTPSVPPGGCPSYCPARLWCWQFKPQGRF